MVEPVPGALQSAFKQAEIHDHSTLQDRAGFAHHDLGAVGMAVDAPARVGVHRPLEGVGRVEPKFLAEFVHQRMPMNLCVCRDRRHWGWSRQ